MTWKIDGGNHYSRKEYRKNNEKNEDSLTPLRQHSHYKGPRRRREKGPDKTFEEMIAGNFPNMGKEIIN